MFTTDNTQEFTVSELSLLNRALGAKIQQMGYGSADTDAQAEIIKSASDQISNNWRGDGSDTVQSLIAS